MTTDSKQLIFELGSNVWIGELDSFEDITVKCIPGKWTVHQKPGYICLHSCSEASHSDSGHEIIKFENCYHNILAVMDAKKMETYFKVRGKYEGGDEPFYYNNVTEDMYTLYECGIGLSLPQIDSWIIKCVMNEQKEAVRIKIVPGEFNEEDLAVFEELTPSECKHTCNFDKFIDGVRIMKRRDCLKEELCKKTSEEKKDRWWHNRSYSYDNNYIITYKDKQYILVGIGKENFDVVIGMKNCAEKSVIESIPKEMIAFIGEEYGFIYDPV